MKTDWIYVIGLCILILLFVILRKQDRKHSSSPKTKAQRKENVTIAFIVIFIFGVVMFFLILMLKDIWNRYLTPI